MQASELCPDEALKQLLEGNVESDIGVLKVYGHESQPNNVTDEDFISIRSNGVITSETIPMDIFKGNLALCIYCRLYSDNTSNIIKAKRLSRICETLVDRKVSGDYFFKLNAANPITPTTGNSTSGYSITVLNVAWRTPVSKV